jgi:hypothetical protein
MRTSGARFPDPDDRPAALKRYSIALPITTMHYITVDAESTEDAEEQAIKEWNRGTDFDFDSGGRIDFNNINVTEVK